MSQKRIIHRVLIANRAEIAGRVARACRALEKEAVCVASEADIGLPYAKAAEKLVKLAGRGSTETYLNIERLLAVAKEQRCDAVHPGYGFLSEREEFAKAVTQAGLTFIGPRAEHIALLGDKTRARREAVAAKVPITPGSEAGLTDKELTQEASRIGYPVLLKASAGGGGRGMRLAENAEQLREALPRARGEALKFFRSEDVYLERWIREPRHIEVQVFGDGRGGVVHLGTRDCSTQRRHQKLIEEAPAPGLSPKLRRAIEDAAVKIAKRVKYLNAGTAEFLVAGEEFFFLEMNTRLQVEHPVTEAVTGLDLVAWQLAIAEGQPLPLKQEEVQVRGHAIEYRLNAEDAEREFTPTTGRISQWSFPSQPWVRVDGGYDVGNDVTSLYDGLLGKLIVSGATRSEALNRGLAALRQSTIGGVRTNLDFHLWMSAHARFRAGPVDIKYVEREAPKELRAAVRELERWDPRHISSTNPVGHIERRRYSSRQFGCECEIEIEHLAGGLFQFVPLTRSGARAAEPHQRTSNDFQAGLLAVCSEVLEAIPPEKLER